MICFGDVPAGSVLPIMFTSYDGATGASEALSGIAVTDIEIYKGTSMTQRSSDSGYTLLDTDGIDLDSIVGLNGFSIDLGDNTVAGFYAAGSFYTVVVSSVTIDGQTVNMIAATFRIREAETTAGRIEARVASIANDAITDAALAADAVTAIQSGLPTALAVSDIDAAVSVIGSNVTDIYLEVVSGDVGGNVAAIKAKTDDLLTETYFDTVMGDWTGENVFDTLVNIDQNVTTILLTDLPAVPTAAEIADAVWDEDLTTHGEADSAGEFLQNAGVIDPGDIAAILEDTGTTIPAQIAALNDLSAAQVNSEVVDALNVDTYAEPGKASPPATTSLVAKIGYLYKTLRNKKDQTGSLFQLYADDGTTVDQKATVSDDGTTATRGEIVSG